MHFTVEELINGNESLIEYYSVALEKWRKLLEENLCKSKEEFGQAIGSAQFWFENRCGGRDLGQEIMAIVAVAQFYSTTAGFDDTRLGELFRLHDAFLASHCSSEVIGAYRRIAKSYSVEEYRE